MNKAGGFITIQRQITDWEWYGDANTFCLFIHLLIEANYIEGRFKGRTIKRGQLVTSLRSLATMSGLSIQQTRTALDHLVSTGEITNETNPEYRIITIVKYDQYQSVTNRSTNDQQTINTQFNKQTTNLLTNDQQQYNNNNNNKQGNNKTMEQEREGTAKRFTPPTKEEILDFCLDEGLGLDVDYFYDYYTSNGWMVGKNRMKDWKATARNWVRRDQEMQRQSPQPQQAVRSSPSQQYSQRDYSGADDEAMRAMMAQFRKDGLI